MGQLENIEEGLARQADAIQKILDRLNSHDARLDLMEIRQNGDPDTTWHPDYPGDPETPYWGAESENVEGNIEVHYIKWRPEEVVPFWTRLNRESSREHVWVTIEVPERYRIEQIDEFLAGMRNSGKTFWVSMRVPSGILIESDMYMDFWRQIRFHMMDETCLMVPVLDWTDFHGEPSMTGFLETAPLIGLNCYSQSGRVSVDERLEAARTWAALHQKDVAIHRWGFRNRTSMDAAYIEDMWGIMNEPGELARIVAAVWYDDGKRTTQNYELRGRALLRFQSICEQVT